MIVKKSKKKKKKKRVEIDFYSLSQYFVNSNIILFIYFFGV